MNPRTVMIAVGEPLFLDGTLVQVTEFDGRRVMVRHPDGSYTGMALAEFVPRARGTRLEPDDGDPGLRLAQLAPGERELVAERARHVREVITGYASGHADGARPGEPRAAFCSDQPWKARYEAKGAELSVTARTIENWVAAYRSGGEPALVDERRGGRRAGSVDPRWDAAVRAELAVGVQASTPTGTALLMRVSDRLEREFGAGVVPIPAKTTAYRRLAALTKGTNALSGSAKGRRSIAERPKGTYGRLRATRPGEYVVLDTQDLDVFAMEPVTCRWVRAQLTVAQDLFDRQILGLKVTPVSTKAIDVAGVLFETVTGRGTGRPSLGPAHGIPQHLVFSETGTVEEVWCPPETLIVDHGKAFLSAHVIGVCTRLGISIQPAQPHKPTDKPTVERFFRSLREGLVQHLPAYKGPDIHSRGVGLEEQAFLFIHELEDVIRDWIVSVHHTRVHEGLAIAEWPGLELSPNDMFALGIAKAGMLRIPAAPGLALEFLRVAWRTIQHYGIEIEGRRYNGPALDAHRNQHSHHGGIAAGKWPIRVNDDDVRFVYFQEPDDGSWHRLDWEHSPLLGTPFSAEAARYARALAARTGRFAEQEQALAEVLGRWTQGEVTDRRERRIAARLSAERAGIQTLVPAELGAGDEALELPVVDVDVVAGDDDTEQELLDDIERPEDGDGFYDDALEVLP